MNPLLCLIAGFVVGAAMAGLFGAWRYRRFWDKESEALIRACAKDCKSVHNLSGDEKRLIEARRVRLYAEREDWLRAELLSGFSMPFMTEGETSIPGAVAFPGIDSVPPVSLEKIADPRYAALEIHALPLEVAKVHYLRVDGQWFVRAVPGVLAAVEKLEAEWRQGILERP